MPRQKKTAVPDPRDVELEKLRQQVAHLSAATASHLNRVEASAPVRLADNVYVGIRNLSDNTIGIPGWNGLDDLHLHADVGELDPASVTAIPYAWWLQLRKSNWVKNGLIVRDDTVLGEGYIAAPADREQDLPADAKFNAIHDPIQWIEARTESEIRADLAKITSEPALRRIRRGVDMRLKQLMDSYGPEIENKAAASWEALEMKYRFVDEQTTHRLERPEDFTTKTRPARR